MTTRQRFQVSLLMAAVAIGMNAAPVDADAARGTAMRFLLSPRMGRLMPVSSSMNLAYTAISKAQPQQADYYVFNASDGGSFVIVSGDDRAEPVLAYGDGVLDMSDVPCNLQWMLDSYSEQLEYLHAHPEAQVELCVPVNDVTIAPLLTCNWGQSAPFYNQCPLFQGERSVTGCVATAMAQVMYYWQYPAQLPSLGGYTTREHRIHVQSLPSTSVEWDNMINDYAATPYSSAQSDAVAKLMRYCGQAVKMDYSPNGSGAYVHDQLAAMKYFGYNHAATQLEKKNYTYDEWDVFLQNELLAGRPVLYSGNDPVAGGHAFVVDGYYDGKYHVNWGWNGSYNGYFALGAFDVRGYKFLALQEILYEMYPSTEHSTQDKYDFEVDGIYYRYGDVDGEAWVTCSNTEYNSYSGRVVIPATVNHDGETLAITAIDDLAFCNCVNLTSVTIPEGVERIGQLAFNSCLALTSVTLPASLERVDARAFVECLSLKSVHAPSLEAWLGIDFAERYANPLSAAHRLVVDGTELEHLVVPAAVGVVRKHAFTDCTTLKSVTLEDGIDAVDTEAFAYCTGLTTLSLPATMTSLATRAFSGCSSLTGAVVPEGITTLSPNLFADCTKLKSVTLPSTLRSVGTSSFKGCSKLESIALPTAVTTIGESAFQSCSSLQRVTLPEGLQTISPDAFNGCSSLTTLVIPDRIEFIAMNTFNGCSALAKLTLGQSLRSIDMKAFAGCKALSAIYCRGIVPADMANPDCFERGIYSRCRLMVPAEAYDTYKKTGIWPWFVNMVSVNVNNPFADVNGDGEVNIADINAVIDAIQNGNASLWYDVNDDTEVNIADVNSIIETIQ